jgi:hypothetical protein
MATSKKAAASKKECTIIAIYKFKTNKKLNGTKCTLVRNGEGKLHKVWTHSNGLKPHCDCEGFEKSHGRRQCYHITSVLARKAAKVVATPATPVEVTSVARELRLTYGSGEYWPQYCENGGEWQYFPSDTWRVHFPGGCEDEARRFIEVDTDEHRQSVLAELRQRAEEEAIAYEARKAAEAEQRQPEQSSDLVERAAARSAKAGKAIDKVLDASEAASQRRMAAPLNGNQGFSLLKKAS